MSKEQTPDYPAILEDPQETARFMNDRIESKLNWYIAHSAEYAGKTWQSWQEKVLDVLYGGNLGIRIPADGDVVCKEGDILMIKWRSPCPVLEHCRKSNQATSRVCSVLYHVQYQALLSLIVPGAFFARDYSQLRPHGDHCTEVIVRRPDGELLEHAWELVRYAQEVAKPLLWLRDSDSCLPLSPQLVDPLRHALTRVSTLPNAVEALCDKMISTYQRAIDKLWVGVGAAKRGSRLGKRTAALGLMRALDYARQEQNEFKQRADNEKLAARTSGIAWSDLFALTQQLIDSLDWGEFVIENARGQSSNLVLESIELLDAVERGQSRTKIQEEIGDVFYNLMAFCLALRIGPQDIAQGERGA